MRIIFLRKEYLSLLPSMIASLFSANGVAAAIDLCQGYDIKASCHASRQSLSGITQDWSIAWICPYISRHLLSLNPLQARCRRYSRGER
ncbi:hypothetical protein D6T62_12970 [Shigella flexneri]|nr:hypothetical protein D6T62_12970 [Shigella flexneri]